MPKEEKKSYIVWVIIEEKTTQPNGDEDYIDTEEMRRIGEYDSLGEAVESMNDL